MIDERFPRAHAIAIGAAMMVSIVLLPAASLSGQTGEILIPPIAVPPQVLTQASAGDTEAQLKLGKLYFDGSSGRENFQEAFKWFQRATNQGSVEAKAYLGQCYLEGLGTPSNIQRASALILSSSDGGSAVGAKLLGALYERGAGVKQDYEQARSFYQLAITRGDPNAYNRLGNLLILGLGGDRDPVNAFALFQKGAEFGDPWSQVSLAKMYANGHYFSTASTKLDIRSGSTLNLQTGLAGGSGSPNRRAPDRELGREKPNYQKALELYTKAAQKGNRMAAYLLGQLYENGEGVAIDYDQSFYWYKLSAARRYTPAYIAIGRAHEQGRGTDVNMLHAYVAYKLAAEAGDNIGRLLLEQAIANMPPDDVTTAESLYRRFKMSPGEHQMDSAMGKQM